MRASLAAVYLLALIVLGLFIQRRWKYIVSYVALLAGALGVLRFWLIRTVFGFWLGVLD